MDEKKGGRKKSRRKEVGGWRVNLLLMGLEIVDMKYGEVKGRG